MELGGERKRETLRGRGKEMYCQIVRKTERTEICGHVEIICKDMNKQ